jgi:hypothetical protein
MSILYILYYIQHNGDVSLEKKKSFFTFSNNGIEWLVNDNS